METVPYTSSEMVERTKQAKLEFEPGTGKQNDLYAGDIKLAPTGAGCFYEFKYYGDVCFVRDSSQKITHITWASPGFTSTWVKK